MISSILDQFASPCVTLEQCINGRWWPATPRDRQILTGAGIEIPFEGLATASIDTVLEAVSDYDYWLQTIPNEVLTAIEESEETN
jgi:hypothetical protein